MECNAKAKTTQTKCRGQAVTGSTKCRLHGGRSPRGIASPHYITGRYSKDLPTRLLSRYAEAKDDARLLELRDEVALVEARLADILTRVDSGESGRIWKELRVAYDEMLDARQANDLGKMALALNTLGALITRGQADWAIWEEVGKQLDRKQRLVESERKRYVEMQQMITSEQAAALFQALFQAVIKHVPDRDIRAAIQADFTRLVDRPEPALVGPRRA